MRLGVEAAIVEGELLQGDVELVDGRIARVGLPGTGRGLAIPGLVDLQVNGFAGIDLAHADAAGYALVAERLAAAGTTSFQPTFVTALEDDLVRALRRVPAACPGLMGAHLEGPFLSPARLGAHLPAGRLDPDPDVLDRLVAAGPVAQMTIAPELPGALALIDRLRTHGVVASLGHTDATSAEATRAFERGVHTVTHLFNAMRPLRQRDPGIVGTSLARPDVIVQLIVDGQHLDDDIVRLVWAAARGRVALVSDSIAAAGLGDGTYPLGPGEVVVRDGVARRTDGVLAGSTLTLLDAVRNLHALAVPLVDAVGAATAIPADLAGRPELGVLRPGAVADVVVLDDRLDVQAVLRGGR